MCFQFLIWFFVLLNSGGGRSRRGRSDSRDRRRRDDSRDRDRDRRRTLLIFQQILQFTQRNSCKISFLI